MWSWTTAEQAAELRRDRILFTRESSPTLGRGHLFDILDARAANGDAAAARLVGVELAKGRLGWTNPWATVRGATTSESYGRELLAITMKPDTWYARVLTSREEIAFVDAAGKPVATASVLDGLRRRRPDLSRDLRRKRVEAGLGRAPHCGDRQRSRGSHP